MFLPSGQQSYSVAPPAVWENVVQVLASFRFVGFAALIRPRWHSQSRSYSSPFSLLAFQKVFRQACSPCGYLAHVPNRFTAQMRDKLCVIKTPH